MLLLEVIEKFWKRVSLRTKKFEKTMTSSHLLKRVAPKQKKQALRPDFNEPDRPRIIHNLESFSTGYLPWLPKKLGGLTNKQIDVLDEAQVERTFFM